MLDEAKKSGGYNFFFEILIFLAVFIIGMLLESAAVAVPYIQYIFGSEDYKILVDEYTNHQISTDELSQGVTDIALNMPNYITIIMLFATVLATVTALIYCRGFEKRKLRTLGFRKSGALKEYLVGMAVGALVFSAAVGICLLTGALEFDGICGNISWSYIALFFAGFLLQGLSEEVIFRGYFTVSLSRRTPIVISILISSVAFAIAHMSNEGMTALAFINLTLFGVFASVYMLKRGNIWGVCAIHSLWNFVQGNLYGISVSGMSDMDSIMKLTSVSSKTLINGGDFGLEGGLAVTAVLTLAILITLCTKTKECERATDETVTAELSEPVAAETVNTES